MNRPTHAYRFGAIVLCLCVATLGFPAYAFAPSKVEPTAPSPKQPRQAVSVELTDDQMVDLSGAYGRSPYIAGSSKWAPIYKGVDLFTGNFSTSATDLSFEGGYGIPINVTRTYSANSYEEGPFGFGWSLSADIRTTAGGLLKSGGSPVRSVPTAFRERPSAQTDPNVESGSQPPAAVIATDASGQEETIQRDVDGILTTPPWDKNTIDSEYETVTLDSTKYEVVKKNTVTTPEGTVYVYEKKGYYEGGESPFGSTADPEPSNILKITSVTDRQGNSTTYSYDTSAYYSYSRSNGTAKEYRLSTVSTPNGHTITFTWGNSTNAPTNKVRTVSDGTRTVTYSYTGGKLETVTNPGGKVTTYGYGAAANATGHTDAPTDLLTTITDPRGLTTTITYRMLQPFILPYGVGLDYTPCVTKIVAPSGLETHFGHYDHAGSGGTDYYTLHHSTPINHGEFYEYEPGNVLETWNAAEVVGGVYSGNLEVYCIFKDPDGAFESISWKKVFDTKTQDMIEQTTYSEPLRWFDEYYGAHYFENASSNLDAVKTVTAYNFMGYPLRKTTYEYPSPTVTTIGSHIYTGWPSVSNGTASRSSEVSYSYWGKEKYWQQKAIRTGSSASYRYSYTDYYDNTASAGSKGQAFKVYDDKRSSLTLDTGVTPPSGTASDDYWRYQLRPETVSGVSTHSAKFEYDSKGRPVDVWKIQTTPNLASPSGWTYVQTRTTYNDASGWYGMIQSVTEDYGTGKINRVTTTNSYDSSGKATSVTDSANRTFVTAYDSEGRVTSVTRTDTTPDVLLVTYSYDGSGGVANGMVDEVVDQSDYTISSGSITYHPVTQTLTYVSSGVGIGQLATISESRTGTSYSTSYDYNAQGERTKVTYSTPNGDVRWHYGHYEAVGDPMQAKRAPQRMTKLDSSSNPTSEEFHYYYDSQGRLLWSAFAQSPQSWSPGSGYSYYDSSHHANRRCLAIYTYDEGGRLGSLAYTWQDWHVSGESGYYDTNGYIGKTEYDYELTGLKRGLRTDLRVYGPNSGNTAFAQTRSEHYEYDSDLDYLTAARYNDNTTAGYEQEDEWAYDAAGNRVSEWHDTSSISPQSSTNFIYDNLNRMTRSPRWTGTSFSSTNLEYESDILGNRLQRGDYWTQDDTYASYLWDDLGRMTKHVNTWAGGASYKYRADGMRIQKTTGVSLVWWEDPINDSSHYDEIYTTNNPTDRYFYDGQMAMEEDHTESVPSSPPNPPTTTVDVTQYGLGARGVDYIKTVPHSGSPAEKYPLYDGNGNMLGTLRRSTSSPYYVVQDGKAYDAWGSVRSGSGGPFLKYCANLGHQSDDESNLVYIRARYCEPWTGRFISEDTGHSGLNWFTYCSNDPVNRIDLNGKYDIGVGLTAFMLGLLGYFASMAVTGNSGLSFFVGVVVPGLASGSTLLAKTIPAWINRILSPVVRALTGPFVAAAERTEAGVAIEAEAKEAGAIAAALIDIGIEEGLLIDGELIIPSWFN